MTNSREQLVERIIDQMQKPSAPMGFNMSHYFAVDPYAEDKSNRGRTTVACLAGWTVFTVDGLEALRALYNRGGYYDDSLGQPRNRICGRAAELLGLDYNDARERLFEPSDHYYDFGTISMEKAIAVFRHFGKTGEVNWNVG